MRYHFLPITSVVLFLSGFAGNVAAEPFDLRGSKLGMTLSEFRTLPHPDGKSDKVICEGDSEYARASSVISDISEDEKIAGATICRHFARDKSGSWRQARLNVATTDLPVEFRFIRDPMHSNEPALYKISVMTGTSDWDKLLEGYITKYGNPTRRSDSPIQNMAGATFDNIEAVWENEESTITLIKRDKRINEGRVSYVHKPLWEEIRRKVEEKQGRPSDKL